MSGHRHSQRHSVHGHDELLFRLRLGVELRTAREVYVLAVRVDARNPLSWLRANAEGLVVLDWETAPPLLLDVGEFLAEDIDLGERLEDALAPSILVMEAG